MPANPERFAEIVKTRRAELGLKQTDVRYLRGPSNAWMTKVERAELELLTPNVAAKLDRGLLWEEGSALRAFFGGEPRSLGPEWEDAVRQLLGGASDEATRRRRLTELSQRGA